MEFKDILEEYTKNMQEIDRLTKINDDLIVKSIEFFIEDNLVKDSDSKLVANNLYSMYESNFQSNGYPIVGSRNFYKYLASKGYPLRNSNKNKLYIFGLGMK